MTLTLTPQQKLRQAATLVEEALAVVHDHPSTCPCCSKPFYGNWAAHQLLEGLQGIPGKIRRHAESDHAFLPQALKAPEFKAHDFKAPELRSCA